MNINKFLVFNELKDHIHNKILVSVLYKEKIE